MYTQSRRAPSSTEPMSQRQKDYIKDLIVARDQDPHVIQIRDDLNACLTNKVKITRKFASDMIDALKSRPVNPKTHEAQAFQSQVEDQKLMEALGQPKMAVGKYAVPAEVNGTGKVQFYNIWVHPSSGNLVLKRLVGAPGDWAKYPVRGAERQRILAAILENMHPYAIEYARLHHTCPRCDAELSDPRSRACYYGPICAPNSGVYYPTEEEARTILEARGEKF